MVQIAFGYFTNEMTSVLLVTLCTPQYLYVDKASYGSTTSFVSTDVLKFDNSYSWTRAKEVLYAVKILPPNSEITVPPFASDTADEEFFECSDEIPQASGTGDAES